MKKLFAAALGAGALTLGTFTALAPSAFASSSTINGTTHCDPSSLACGANPVLTGPPPPFVSIPSNCPSFISTDDWALNFVGGNSVSHGTLNKNGDWGGGTAEGPAVLTSSDGTVQYTGHVTEWFGGGQNSNPGGVPLNQSEMGFTLNFNGSGLAGSISIHVNGHSTTNNSGTPTANFQNATVTCS